MSRYLDVSTLSRRLGCGAPGANDIASGYRARTSARKLTERSAGSASAPCNESGSSADTVPLLPLRPGPLQLVEDVRAVQPGGLDDGELGKAGAEPVRWLVGQVEHARVGNHRLVIEHLDRRVD